MWTSASHEVYQQAPGMLPYMKIAFKTVETSKIFDLQKTVSGAQCSQLKKSITLLIKNLNHHPPEGFAFLIAIEAMRVSTSTTGFTIMLGAPIRTP